jgi:hypothetical protein
MNPDQLRTAGIRLFGRKHWKAQLARALAVDVSTIHRIGKRAEVPGPVEVAVKGLLQHKRAHDLLEREARKLVPRKFRKRPEKSRKVKRKRPATARHEENDLEKIPYAGSERLEPDCADEPGAGD